MKYWDNLNITIMTVFGEQAINNAPAVFHTPTGDVELDVVLEETAQHEELAHGMFRDVSHTVMLPTVRLAGTGIGLRQTVTVRGQLFNITVHQPDIDGMTIFGVRFYQNKFPTS